MAKEKYSCGYANEKYKPFKIEEEKYNLKLKKDKYYIIRFDGKNMTAAFKIKHKPINEPFFNTMEATFTNFCKSSMPNILFAYSFSDEISILIKSSKNSDAINNRIEKLLSLLAGKLALLFYKNARKYKLDLMGKDWLFDARVIELEQQEVVDYFISRQAFAIDKYIMQLKGEHKIDYRLNTSQEVLSELKKLGVNYDTLPVNYRYGLIYAKQKDCNSFEFDANKSLLQKLCFNKI